MKNKTLRQGPQDLIKPNSEQISWPERSPRLPAPAPLPPLPTGQEPVRTWTASPCLSDPGQDSSAGFLHQAQATVRFV